MKLWRSCYFQNPDEAALDTTCTSSAMQESSGPHLDGNYQPSETCIFGTENRKSENNNVLDEMLLLKEWGSIFHNQDYIDKIKEFQLYVDMVKSDERLLELWLPTELLIRLNELVAHFPLETLRVPAEALKNLARFLASCHKLVKRFTRPGCSAEALDVALSSLSSLADTLSAMPSSKRHIIHARL